MLIESDIVRYKYIWNISTQIKWKGRGEIYLKYLDKDKMRGYYVVKCELDTFKGPFPIVQWGVTWSYQDKTLFECSESRYAENGIGASWVSLYCLDCQTPPIYRLHFLERPSFTPTPNPLLITYHQNQFVQNTRSQQWNVIFTWKEIKSYLARLGADFFFIKF